MEFVRRRVKPEGIRIETPADLLPHIRHYADRKQEHFLCASARGLRRIFNRADYFSFLENGILFQKVGELNIKDTK